MSTTTAATPQQFARTASRALAAVDIGRMAEPAIAAFGRLGFHGACAGLALEGLAVALAALHASRRPSRRPSRGMRRHTRRAKAAQGEGS